MLEFRKATLNHSFNTKRLSPYPDGKGTYEED